MMIVVISSVVVIAVVGSVVVILTVLVILILVLIWISGVPIWVTRVFGVLIWGFLRNGTTTILRLNNFKLVASAIEIEEKVRKS